MNQAIIDQKRQVIDEISEKLGRAKSVVLVRYEGLNVEKTTDLRNKCRAAGVEYKVYKNTLMRFAFKEHGLEGFNENLEGPNAIAISYDDAVAAAKITSEFAKLNDKLEIKAGVVEGELMTADEIKLVATIPSREILLTQLAGVLQANIKNLAYMLDQISKKEEIAI